ncbi:MAG TPA: hypothetical protein VGA73_03635 [Candidatus Binatia bacterium]
MLQFVQKQDDDPNGAALRSLLDAHVRYQRVSAAKKIYLHLLAAVGALVWMGALWPALLPVQVEDFALALWGGLFLLILWASFDEWSWHRRVENYRKEQQAKQAEGAH